MYVLVQCLDFFSAVDALDFEMFALHEILWLIFLTILKALKGLAVYCMMHHSMIILYYILSCDIGKISGYIR